MRPTLDAAGVASTSGSFLKFLSACWSSSQTQTPAQEEEVQDQGLILLHPSVS